MFKILEKKSFLEILIETNASNFVNAHGETETKDLFLPYYDKIVDKLLSLNI